MAETILTRFQEEILTSLSNNKFVYLNFYLGGGTALAEFYLKHRLSEDLDFFTTKELSFADVRINLEKSFQKIGITSLEYREEASAKLFFLRKGKREVIKTDFNYFPFKRLKKGTIFNKIEVDSLLDIAVNKLHLILTRSNARDFVDFFFIQKRENYPLDFLLKKLEKKFSWKVDPIFLGSRFLKIIDLKDYPKMRKKFRQKKLIDYFSLLAKQQKGKFLK